MLAFTLNVFRTRGLAAAIHFHFSNKAENDAKRSFALSRTDSGSLSLIRRRITGTLRHPADQPIDYDAMDLSLEQVAFLDQLTRIQDLLVARQREARNYVFKLEFEGDVMTTEFYRLVTYRAGKEQTKLSQVEIHGLR